MRPTKPPPSALVRRLVKARITELSRKRVGGDRRRCCTLSWGQGLHSAMVPRIRRQYVARSRQGGLRYGRAACGLEVLPRLSPYRLQWSTPMEPGAPANKPQRWARVLPDHYRDYPVSYRGQWFRIAERHD